MDLLEIGVFRGPRPDPAILAQLVVRKVRGILDLESGFYELWTRERDQEEFLARACNLEHYHLGLSDITPPTLPELLVAHGVMKDFLARGGVYVHCLHGVDRTGVVCAAWRVWERKWSVDDAVAEMLAKGFHKRWYAWWLGRIRRTLART